MALTVGDLEAQQSDKQERGNVGELVALETEVFVHSHDGRILQNAMLDYAHARLTMDRGACVLTLRMTLSRNCIV